MNILKTIDNISPFLIIGIITILWSSVNMIIIYTYKKQDVINLPLLFIFFAVGIALLFIDRWAIGLWGQKPVIWAELILIPIFYFTFCFFNRKIIILPTDGIQSFGVVYNIEDKRATTTEYTLPFNQTTAPHPFPKSRRLEGWGFADYCRSF